MSVTRAGGMATSYPVAANSRSSVCPPPSTEHEMINISRLREARRTTQWHQNSPMTDLLFGGDGGGGEWRLGFGEICAAGRLGAGQKGAMATEGFCREARGAGRASSGVGRQNEDTPRVSGRRRSNARSKGTRGRKLFPVGWLGRPGSLMGWRKGITAHVATNSNICFSNI